MGLFGGPSKKVLDNITTGAAAVIMEEFSQNGFQNSYFFRQTFRDIAESVHDLKLGMIGKAKFLATIRAKLMMMGMPQSKADYIQGLIEIEMRSMR